MSNQPEARPALSSSTPVIRIIAQPIPWPSLTQKPNRSGLKLQWRCLTEDGQELVKATSHPFTDVAAVLFETGKVSGDALVTFRHEGKDYDSFKPMRLSVAAAEGMRRRAKREMLHTLSKGSAMNKAQHPTQPAAA